MTAQNGEGVYGDGVGVVTPLAHKLSQNGPVVKDSTGKPRSGVFYAGTASLVTGKANMSYDVAAFEAAICRGRTKGTSFPTNDAVVNVTTTAAPGSNKRIDIIYVQQKEVSEGDDATEAVIGVVQGTAASSPTAPTLPDGAIELARAEVTAGITATTSATITQTAPFTAPLGSPIPFRNATARDAAGAFVAGTKAHLIDTGVEYVYDGSAWRPQISGGQTPTSVVVGSGSSSVASDGTVSFTGASTVSLNGVFDDPTANYEVVVTVAHSASGTVFLRMRGAGADVAANYSFVYNVTQLSAGPTRSSSTSGSGFGFLRSAATGTNGDLRGRYTLFTPKSTSLAVVLEGASASAYNGDRFHVEEMGLVAPGASGFDGVTIVASAGTMTGTIKVRKL